MSKLPHDINDDEIRIISSESGKNTLNTDNTSNNRFKWNKWWIIALILFIGALAVFFWWEVKRDAEEKEIVTITKVPPINFVQNIPEITNGFVEIQDTTVNDVPLTVLTPVDLIPSLEVGTEILKDTTTKFVVQAADIRQDNGGIVGAYVSKGNLLSKGQAKSGFCAIIDNKIIIGVATSTPYLEEAIESNGYFFRQYPLVVGGQVVDNKLPSSSLRKALAQLNGKIVVIMSQKNLTLNAFSETLVNLGVSDAIYLVGSKSYGFAIDKEGYKIEFGKEETQPALNTNYIVWKEV